MLLNKTIKLNKTHGASTCVIVQAEVIEVKNIQEFTNPGAARERGLFRVFRVPPSHFAP